jgi:hypothetical protein
VVLTHSSNEQNIFDNKETTKSINSKDEFTQIDIVEKNKIQHDKKFLDVQPKKIVNFHESNFFEEP